jgi:calcium-dependent protein kinase
LNLGFSEEEWEEIIDQVGFDKDGIDYQEFLTAAVDKRKIVNKENIKMAFDMFDIDGDGEIDI